MARRFGRRKRPKVAWFPVFGGAPLAEATAGPTPGVSANIQVNTLLPNGDVFWDAQALTFDISEGAVAAQGDPNAKTLQDIIKGNEWRFRRLVGKAFISAATATVGATAYTLADVGLGFIVCDTDDDGAPRTDFNSVNPLSQDSMEDPWIWRRRWLLNPHGDIRWNTPVTTDTTNNAAAWGFPASTAGYGSVLDGPHIDAKSNRIIHRSERLFVVLAARKFNPQIGSVTAVADFEVNMLLDYRLLGSLRGSSYGNRGNTSR